MCNFLSILIDRQNPDKLYIGDLRSHSETASDLGLKPETYREVEWTADDSGDSLTVRTLPDDPHDEGWYKASILTRFPQRSVLVNWCLRNLPATVRGTLDVSGCDLKGVTLPAKIGGTLYVRGCDLKGVTLPAKIGGCLYVRGCDLKGVTLPKGVRIVR